eukprot:TRINITY_DN72408_c0_g1_i1.p1 TRINITY_DN72408_c0_g1~~TRINITY_DN72408_c0_g1_i1.p1  ORF type:complete len:518 (-),score=57.65 TRINITY_DN72408_c0_g1_i1:112-1665(-)
MVSMTFAHSARRTALLQCLPLLIIVAMLRQFGKPERLLSKAPVGYDTFVTYKVNIRGSQRRAKMSMKAEAAEEDWREFRARLVKSEQGPVDGAEEAAEGWVHQTPMVERGSVLLSADGNQFALSQQYLHKAVILLIQHGAEGDVGIMLNRPTAFTTNDFSFMRPPTDGDDASQQEGWNVWFGGDCQGIIDKFNPTATFCIHTLSELADESQPVINGVYLIKLAKAQAAVAAGRAKPDDFLVALGYCVWNPGHLQSEVNRGDTWILTSADQKALLGELQESQSELRASLSKGEGLPMQATDIGSGLDRWLKLYNRVEREIELDAASIDALVAGCHVDDLLNLWIERCLIPESQEMSESRQRDEIPPLPAGTILRGSATAWALGKPAEDKVFSHFPPTSWRPHQYLHKSVLLLLNAAADGQRSLLVLLNGPTFRLNKEGQEVSLGGTREMKEGKMFGLGNEETGVLRVQGYVSFRPQILEKLVALDALQVASGVDITKMLATPKPKRWQVRPSQASQGS